MGPWRRKWMSSRGTCIMPGQPLTRCTGRPLSKSDPWSTTSQSVWSLPLRQGTVVPDADAYGPAAARGIADVCDGKKTRQSKFDSRGADCEKSAVVDSRCEKRAREVTLPETLRTEDRQELSFLESARADSGTSKVRSEIRARDWEHPRERDGHSAPNDVGLQLPGGCCAVLFPVSSSDLCSQLHAAYRQLVPPSASCSATSLVLSFPSRPNASSPTRPLLPSPHALPSPVSLHASTSPRFQASPVLMPRARPEVTKKASLASPWVNPARRARLLRNT